MKALTIWQPWASLIMAGAKPFEFRGWRAPGWLIGRDLVIHAGSRPIRASEVEDLFERLDDEREAWTTGLFRDKAEPILRRALCQANYKPPKVKKVAADLFGAPPPPPPPPAPRFDFLPMAAGLGLVRVGTPIDGNDTAERFGHKINDSDRQAHANWGWPMEDIRPFTDPFPISGAQGLWDWPTPESVGL